MSKILIILDVDYLVKHGLSNNEGAVLNVLAYRSRDGLCKISCSEIAQYSNIGKETARTIVNTLIDKGLILKEGDLYMVTENGAIKPENGAIKPENGAIKPENGAKSKERERKEAKERIKKENNTGEYNIYNAPNGAKAPDNFSKFKRNNSSAASDMPVERPSSKEVWQTALKYKDHLQFAKNPVFIRDMEDFFLNEDGWGWDAGRKGHWESRLKRRLNTNRDKYIEAEQRYLYPG